MFTTEAILIRVTRLTDTSLIVHWLSAQEGLVKTVAKGALRPKSPFSGKLDLFFSAEITAVRLRKGDLHILTEVSVSHWREGLRRSYIATLMAGYFCQLVEAGLEPGHADPPLHALLHGALDWLEKEEPTLKVLRHFEKRLAGVIGISGGNDAPEIALRDHLGSLPRARMQLLERFGES